MFREVHLLELHGVRKLPALQNTREAIQYESVPRVDKKYDMFLPSFPQISSFVEPSRFSADILADDAKDVSR